ncbi:MAG: iron ABC transporter permease [Chloroflexi bacterium]|nr:iron ABC transporter permease [Chloroflexota bacterium]
MAGTEEALIGAANARPRSGMRGIAMPRAETLVMAAAIVITSVGILYPVGQLLLGSFIDNKTDAFTLANFQYILDTARLRVAVGNTLILAAGTAAGSTILGVVLAWITARTNSFGRDKFEFLNVVPFFTSSFVGAMAWRFLLSPNIGMINVFLRDTLGIDSPLTSYGMGGMIWVMSLFCTPYVYLFTLSSFRNMDPSLEETARVHGAGVLRTMLMVTVPISAPAILNGALFVFLIACGMLEVPLALGRSEGVYTLSIEIYEVLQYPPNLHLASALATIVLSLTMAGVYIQRRIIMPRSFVTVTGKGYRPNIIDLGPWRFLTFGLNLLYLLVAIILPFLALIEVSLSNVWRGHFDLSEFTLDNYAFVLFDYDMAVRAIRNSLLLAVSVATVGTLLAVILSYIIYRTRIRGRSVLDFICTVPIAVPGVALGMALLIAWIRTPLYATLGILFVAYMTRWLPLAQKSVSAVLLSVSHELDECGRVSGASWLKTIQAIVLPLLKPGLASAWLMMFVVVIRELSASLLLYTSGTEVMSVALWLLTLKDMPTVAAFAMVQTVVLMIATVIFGRTVGKDLVL